MIAIPRPEKMDNRQLDVLIRELSDQVEGELGFWQFHYDATMLMCITDEYHNRMRVMTPIVKIDDLTSQQLVNCMHANFDRALDARYCLNEDRLWGAFIHPLGSLTADDFTSACRQVAQVAQTFDDTYTSGQLAFGG